MKTNQSQKIISNKWQEKTLGDFLSKLEGGGTPSKDNSDYWNGLIPWASVKDVVTHNPNDTQDHISELGLKNSSSRLVTKGTLIVPTRMALGHAVVFNVDVAINQDLKALYPREDLLNKYLFYWFLFKKEFIERLGSGSTVSGIQQNELKKIKFNLPPLSEQNRIVSVLETWDKVIENLNKKIEIKKQIKKGLMQDLLTGKKRLSGFKDKWEVKKLGDLCDIGTGKKNNQDKIKNGKYPFFVRSQFVERINSYSYDGEAILIPGEGNIGKIFHYINGKFDFHQRVYKISDFKKGVSGKYIYFYIFKNFSKTTKSDSVKATVDSLRLPTFTNFKVNIPTLREQESIVNILTMADKEITELENKLSIIKDQKKFLLNNLITGAIRTPALLNNFKL